MKLEIRKYDEFEIRNRIGPLFKPCNNMMPAREAWKFVRPMVEVLEATQGAGVGLAANQVGLDIPLFILRFEDQVQPCYRPRLLKMSKSFVSSIEECLSLPGVKAKADRYERIEVDFIAYPNNKRRRLELCGLWSKVFQHEMEHLKGKTILDHYQRIS